MIRGLYVSAAGMLPLNYSQDLVTNNLANVNTAGYKRDQAFVRELITADLYLNENQIASTGARPAKVNVIPPAFRASVGNSSQVVQQETIFTQGPMEITGNDYNLAIQGDGFFSVQTPQGIQYTRNGLLQISPDGELVTADGNTVLGTGGPINVQGGKLNVAENGDVYVNNELRGTLAIVDFGKPYKLSKASHSLFVPEGGVGAQAAQNFKVTQGMLEGANVSAVDHLVRMIEIERTFELGSRAIRLQDETLQQAVSQVGRI